MLFNRNTVPAINVGDTIEHPIFQKGIVINIDSSNSIYEIKFENEQIRHLTKQGISKCKKLIGKNEEALKT